MFKCFLWGDIEMEEKREKKALWRAKVALKEKSSNLNMEHLMPSWSVVMETWGPRVALCSCHGNMTPSNVNMRSRHENMTLVCKLLSSWKRHPPFSMSSRYWSVTLQVTIHSGHRIKNKLIKKVELLFCVRVQSSGKRDTPVHLS